MKMSSINNPNLPKGKELMMKKTLKIIADISIILFGLFFIASKFSDVEIFDNEDVRHSLVIIYLISNLLYSRMELKDKNQKIKELEYKIQSFSSNP